MLIFCLLLANCTNHDTCNSLDEINLKIPENPASALSFLDSIDTDLLNDECKAIHALLCVKANDKSYTKHASDSAIQIAVKYFTEHPDRTITPEALYYGGRVYSDLGDYMTSLDYFQQALQLLPEGTDNKTLRGNVLSQTGRLLMNIGMFSKSIQYIKDVISLDEEILDTINLAYDNRLLGDVFSHIHEFDSAYFYYEQSIRHIHSLPKEFEAETKVCIADCKYEEGKVAEALSLIRPAIPHVTQEFEGYTLANAANIYYKANIFDSAYMYSKKLVSDTNISNRKTGYKIMLSQELREYLPQDSIQYLLYDYKNVIEQTFFNRDTNETLIQNAYFDYSQHAKKRYEAELKSRNLTIIILIITILLFVALTIAIYIYYNNKNKIFKLQNTINKLTRLTESINNNTIENNQESVFSEIEPNIIKSPSTYKATKESLTQKIDDILNNIRDSTSTQCPVSHSILQSEAYASICEYINRKEIIPISAEHLWQDLGKAILLDSPDFIRHIQLLYGENIDEYNFKIIVSIKCGITSAQSSRLLGRSKSTINYRRMAISSKILGDKSKVNYLDDVIKSL